MSLSFCHICRKSDDKMVVKLGANPKLIRLKDLVKFWLFGLVFGYYTFQDESEIKCCYGPTVGIDNQLFAQMPQTGTTLSGSWTVCALMWFWYCIHIADESLCF